jgi:hypothetical protein
MLIFGAVVLVILVIALLRLKRERTEWVDRFPPISDEQFLAQCCPGADPEIALKVRQIVAKHSGIEYPRIHAHMNFVSDLF